MTEEIKTTSQNPIKPIMATISEIAKAMDVKVGDIQKTIHLNNIQGEFKRQTNGGYAKVYDLHLVKKLCYPSVN